MMINNIISNLDWLEMRINSLENPKFTDLDHDLKQKMAQAVLQDERLKDMFKRMQLIETQQGASSVGWDAYHPPIVIPEWILLGNLKAFAEYLDLPLEYLDILEAIPGFCKDTRLYKIPYLLPMAKPFFLYGISDTSSKQLNEVFTSLICRLLRYSPMNQTRITIFDFKNRGIGLVNNIMHLADDGDSSLCSYYVSENDIYNQLKLVVDYIDIVCAKLAKAGCTDYSEYNTVFRQDRIQHKVLVIYDYPFGIDGRALRMLEIVLTKAKQCGISIMLGQNSQTELDNNAKTVLDALKKECIMLKISDDNCQLTDSDEMECLLEPVIHNVDALFYEQIKEKFTYKPSIRNAFSDFFSEENLPQYRDSTERLMLPFAIDRMGELNELEFDNQLKAFGFVSGGVGSGKTSFMHMIITGAMMYYHPKDLELWLVDYKSTEFRLYSENCPPHIRYIIADDSDEISYDFIRQLKEEYRRRQMLFNRVGVKDFVEYRHNGHEMPRLLVLVDECHRLSQASMEDAELKIMIQQLFAEVRHAGINILLGDQFSKSGLGGFTPDTADKIVVRVAMRNTSEEIMTTLNLPTMNEEIRKNIAETASAETGSLMFKKEVHYPDGRSESQGVAAKAMYVSRDEIKKIILAVSKRNAGFERKHDYYFGGDRTPMNKDKIKDFEDNYPCEEKEVERFYIGTPLGIRYCFYMDLGMTKGENVLLIGPNQEMKYSIINALGACAGRYGYDITILGMMKSAMCKTYPDLFETVGRKKGIVKFGEVCQYIGETAEYIDEYMTLLDEDDDDELEDYENKKMLLIITDMDLMMEKMEMKKLSTRAEAIQQYQNRLTERENKQTSVAVTIQENVRKPEPEADLLESRIQSLLFAGTAMEQNINNQMIDADAFEKFMAERMNSSGIQMNDSEEEAFAMPERSIKIPAYNAVRDLTTILEKGYMCGIHVVCVMDSGATVKQRRRLFEENFNHRLTMPMNLDDAANFMSRTKVLSSLVDKNDTKQAVYECKGGREQTFRPYIFD